MGYISKDESKHSSCYMCTYMSKAKTTALVISQKHSIPPEKQIHGTPHIKARINRWHSSPFLDAQADNGVFFIFLYKSFNHLYWLWDCALKQLELEK